MDDPLGCDPVVPTGFQIENNVLAGTSHAGDFSGLECGGDLIGGGFKRLRFRSQPDGLNYVAGNALVQTARDGFDFGEFGHKEN